MNENSEGIAQILAACNATTVDQAFLGVDSSVEFTHLDMFMKAVINRISVKFAHGYVDYDMNIPVVENKYWLGLTCEQPEPGATFQQKIRVMVISDECLRNIPHYTEPPKFDIPGHKARWKCLQQMEKILNEDEKIKQEGQGDFWKRLVLRQVSIFRPLYNQYDYHSQEDLFTKRKDEERHLSSSSSSSNLDLGAKESKSFSTKTRIKMKLKQSSPCGSAGNASNMAATTAVVASGGGGGGGGASTMNKHCLQSMEMRLQAMEKSIAQVASMMESVVERMSK